MKRIKMIIKASTESFFASPYAVSKHSYHRSMLLHAYTHRHVDQTLPYDVPSASKVKKMHVTFESCAQLCVLTLYFFNVACNFSKVARNFQKLRTLFKSQFSKVACTFQKLSATFKSCVHFQKMPVTFQKSIFKSCVHFSKVARNF